MSARAETEKTQDGQISPNGEGPKLRDIKIIEDHGGYLIVEDYFEGIHPELGYIKTRDTWSLGPETVRRRFVARPMGTFEIKPKDSVALSLE